jgi:hypothetical protein
LSEAGDPLERLSTVIDFELFHPELEAVLARADRARGGRPPYDAVLMFKVLVVQTLYTLSDDQTEYQIKDRLSFMRFVGLELCDPVPDAKTIWLYRETLLTSPPSSTTTITIPSPFDGPNRPTISSPQSSASASTMLPHHKPTNF